MKRIFPAASCLLAIAVSSSADLTLEQNVEGGPQSGQIVMRVKGDRFRLDLPGGPTGPVSTIMDVKAGLTITLFHQRKISITRHGAQPGQTQDAQAKRTDADSPKPHATSRTERVGEYDAEIYTMPSGGFQETLWVAKEFPNFQAIKEDLRRITNTATAGTLDLTSLPGMVVKREKERGGQKVTITLTSVKQDTLDDAIFEIPAGYKPVIPPAATRN